MSRNVLRPNNHPDRRMLTLSDVANRLAVSKKSITKWCAEGKFPRPILVGGRLLRWNPGTIEKYLQDSST